MSKKPEILIIEDDVWMAEQHARVLKKAGYITKIVSNGFDAIEIIDEDIPDVIILDVLLPASTGFALLHELQSYPDTGVIPVILCTNLAPEISTHDIGPYGIKRILDKSNMEPGDVVAAVRSVLI